MWSSISFQSNQIFTSIPSTETIKNSNNDLGAKSKVIPQFSVNLPLNFWYSWCVVLLETLSLLNSRVTILDWFPSDHSGYDFLSLFFWFPFISLISYTEGVHNSVIWPFLFSKYLSHLVPWLHYSLHINNNSQVYLDSPELSPELPLTLLHSPSWTSRRPLKLNTSKRRLLLFPLHTFSVPRELYNLHPHSGICSLWLLSQITTCLVS